MRKLFSSNRYLLSLIVITFFISAVVSLVQLRQSISILETHYGTSVWSVFQLKVELRRFTDSLTLYQHDTSTYEEVKNRYNILWSRFPILLEGKDAIDIQKIEHAEEFLKHAFDTLKSLENDVFTTLSTNPDHTHWIKQQLAPHLKNIEMLSLESYHANHDFHHNEDQKVSALQQDLILLMVGLIISGFLLLLMVLKENKQNRYQAEHDNLTGLPNRAFLRDYVRAFCMHRTPFTLYMIDLNGFKDVNDALGHYTGDLLLKAVAERLVERVDKEHKSVTCRLGGDEFAIISPYISPSQVNNLSHKIIAALESEFKILNHHCYVTASIGSAVHPEQGIDVSTLLSRADIAMYIAKKSAPESKHQPFHSEMDNQIHRKQVLQRDLRSAIDNDELSLAYQTIVSLPSTDIAYLEALLRWQHPVLGAIPPLEIIEIAENYSLAIKLGTWVINTACKHSRHWVDLGYKQVPISVNISPSLYRIDLASAINSALDRYQLPHGTLWIEVTEDTSMSMLKEAHFQLKDLQTEGIKIALDDFGTGLSSLSLLQQLDIEVLKIDRSFVQNITHDSTRSDLLKNIIGIGHDLGMEVVAEGIENPESAKILSQYGCDYGQGYTFSRPMDAEDVTALLNFNAPPLNNTY